MASLSSRIHDVAQQMRRVYEDGQPAVLRSAGPIFEVAEIFDWIRRAHPPTKTSTSAQKIQNLKRGWGLDPGVEPEAQSSTPGRPPEIYKDAGMLLDPSPYLPAQTHQDFLQWVQETREQLGGDFGMQAPGLECASWDALTRLQRLLAPTLALTGPRSYRYNAFLGDYRRTPFGFHTDPHQEAVFQYIAHGSRRGHFWEGLTLNEADAKWVEDPNGRTEPTRPPEQSFDLETGDIVFWPGTHVHGFEATGPSLGLSMVIDRASPQTREQVVTGLEAATLGGRAALPPIDEDTYVEPHTRLERRSPFPIVYERHDDALIIGVCGRTFDWPDRLSIAEITQVFDRINEVDSLVVAEFARTHSSQTLPFEDLCETLAMLASLGFLGAD